MSNITSDFTGKSVIVTGAARGIGQAIARHFVNTHATVFMVDSDKDELTRSAADVGAVGIPADVGQTEDAEHVMSTVDAGLTGSIARLADPTEIADAICLLASEEAGYITGVVLPVDGGVSM